MRCLACGSAISNNQQPCWHCHRDTLPSQQALDACLVLLLLAACVGYFIDDRVVALVCLAVIAGCAALVIRVKRLQCLRDPRVLDRRSLPQAPET